METKHTKGEWEIVMGAMTTAIETGKTSICQMNSGLSEVNKANAKLIKEAPNMLRALKLSIKMLDHIGCVQSCDGNGTLPDGYQCQWCNEKEVIKEVIKKATS